MGKTKHVCHRCKQPKNANIDVGKDKLSGPERATRFANVSIFNSARKPHPATTASDLPRGGVVDNANANNNLKAVRSPTGRDDVISELAIKLGRALLLLASLTIPLPRQRSPRGSRCRCWYPPWHRCSPSECWLADQVPRRGRRATRTRSRREF